ncbi:968_t:CDS:2, partial [Gigaspora margarita]
GILSEPANQTTLCNDTQKLPDESTKEVGPELVQVAIRVHGICINSAFFRKIKISKKYNSQVRRLHVAAPISSGDKGTEQELVNSDSDYQVSDDGYYVEKDKTTRQTNESLEENKYLGEEEQRLSLKSIKNKDDEILLSSEWDSDFSLEGRKKYSTDNKMAK